jgi:hypothetical protein
MHHLRPIRRLVLGAALAGAAIGAVPAMANAASTCSYDPALKRATVVDGSGSDPLRVVRTGVFITVADGSAAAKSCSGGFFKFATIDNTDDIRVTRGPASGTDTVTLDESAGVFGPGATLESTGTSEIETTVSSGGSPFDLVVIGTEEHDVVAVSAAVNLNLNDDSDTDLTATGSARTVTINGRGGGDVITGTGTAAPGVLGTRSTRVPLFLNGDAGDDLLIGGLAVDRFHGGQGDDIMRSSDDASDVLFGESGFDIADHDSSDVFGDAVEIRHVVS